MKTEIAGTQIDGTAIAHVPSNPSISAVIDLQKVWSGFMETGNMIGQIILKSQCKAGEDSKGFFQPFSLEKMFTIGRHFCVLVVAAVLSHKAFIRNIR
ncbi:hypothetical protein ACTM9N_02975 [Lachnospiraceae bacterium HCP1S3_A8]